MKQIVCSPVIMGILLLTGCGGGDGGNPATPLTPTPTASSTPEPLPSPTPTPSPTPSPLSSTQKLKESIAFGGPIIVSPVEISINTMTGQSALPDGVAVPADDPKLRILGGRHVRGKSTPSNQFLTPQAITANPTTAALNEVTASRWGSNNGVEFILPAMQSEFELVLYGTGTNSSLLIEIDGKLTNDAGYDIKQDSTNTYKYTMIRLPSSITARNIRLLYGWRPIKEIRLPAGQMLESRPTSDDNIASVVFIGDSITEGSVATHINLSWTQVASSLLGIRDPIISAIGGTGYLRNRSTQQNFLQRPEDVLQAVNGGPPDAVVIAGGLNDCGAEGADFTPSEINLAATSYFKKIREGAPGVPIFVLAPFSSYDGVPYPAYLGRCRDAIFQAASSVSMTYTIDTSTWITLENRDQIFKGTANGPHPITSGHKIYGYQAADEIRAIISRW